MRLVTVLGTRPQLIKAAPVQRALAERGIEELVIDTGQHYDRELAEDLRSELGLRPPEINCRVGSASHGAQTGRMLEAIESALLDLQPDRVLVYGDTNSTLAGALAAAKLAVPVSHVEAGLRSGDPTMPEEINRVLTDRLADQHFAPTAKAGERLRREGFESVHVVGDVMLDAARHFAPSAAAAQERVATLLGSELHRPLLYVTVHRAENTEASKLSSIVDALTALADEFDVVWPVHPRTRAALDSAGLQPDARLRQIRPCSYLDSLSLLRCARAAITDSGGLQKEAFFLGCPAITLRRDTEWRELLDNGWNVLAPPGPSLETELRRLLARARPEEADVSAFGGGRAAQEIARHLADSSS